MLFRSAPQSSLIEFRGTLISGAPISRRPRKGRVQLARNRKLLVDAFGPEGPAIDEIVNRADELSTRDSSPSLQRNV